MQWLYAWSRHTWDAFVEDGPRSQITPRGFKVNNKIKIKDFISFVDVWCVLCALRVSGVLFECVRDGPSQRYRSDLKTKALTEHHIHQKQINGWKRDSYTYYIGIECEPAPKKVINTFWWCALKTIRFMRAFDRQKISFFHARKSQSRNLSIHIHFGGNFILGDLAMYAMERWLRLAACRLFKRSFCCSKTNDDEDFLSTFSYSWHCFFVVSM